MATDHDDENQLPDWRIKELQEAEPLSAEELRELEPLKPLFFEALAKAGRAAPQPRRAPSTQAVDVILSLAGNIIRTAADLAVQALPLGGVSQPVPVLLRGHKAAPPAEPAHEEVESFVKGLDDFDIVGTTLRSSRGVELRIDVLPKSNKPAPRPLDVRVVDDEGNETVPHERLPRGTGSPIFPPLPPGVYVFELSWSGCCQELRIEFLDT